MKTHSDKAMDKGKVAWPTGPDKVTKGLATPSRTDPEAWTKP